MTCGFLTPKNISGSWWNSRRVTTNLREYLTLHLSSLILILCVVRVVASPSFPYLTGLCFTVIGHFLIFVYEFLKHPPGGYCKEYVKGQRPVGVMLDDT